MCVALSFFLSLSLSLCERAQECTPTCTSMSMFAMVAKKRDSLTPRLFWQEADRPLNQTGTRKPKAPNPPAGFLKATGSRGLQGLICWLGLNGLKLMPDILSVYTSKYQSYYKIVHISLICVHFPTCDVFCKRKLPAWLTQCLKPCAALPKPHKPKASKPSHSIAQTTKHDNYPNKMPQTSPANRPLISLQLL